MWYYGIRTLLIVCHYFWELLNTESEKLDTLEASMAKCLPISWSHQLGQLLHALGKVYVFLTVSLDYTIYDYRKARPSFQSTGRASRLT